MSNKSNKPQKFSSRATQNVSENYNSTKTYKQLSMLNKTIYDMTKKYAGLIANALENGYRGYKIDDRPQSSQTAPTPSTSQSPTSPLSTTTAQSATPTPQTVSVSSRTAARPPGTSNDPTLKRSALRRQKIRKGSATPTSAALASAALTNTTETTYIKLNSLFESIIEQDTILEYANTKYEDDIANYMFANMVKSVPDATIKAAATKKVDQISHQIELDGNKLTSNSMKMLQDLVTVLVRSLNIDFTGNSLSLVPSPDGGSTGQRSNTTNQQDSQQQLSTVSKLFIDNLSKLGSAEKEKLLSRLFIDLAQNDGTRAHRVARKMATIAQQPQNTTESKVYKKPKNKTK